MNNLWWTSRKWLKFMLIIVSCLSLLAPVTFIFVYAGNYAQNPHPTLSSLQLSFDDKTTYICQLDDQKITNSIDETIDALIHQNKLLFAQSTDWQTNTNLQPFAAGSHLNETDINYTKKVAKDYVDKNFNDKKIPSYDNVDDYYLNQKMDLQTKIFSQVDRKIKNHSVIAKNFFDGKMIVFDTKKFNDFEVFISWNISIGEIVSKVKSSLNAALATTAITAVATIASLIIGTIIPFLAWTLAGNIGILAFEYLLCSLVLVGTLKALTSIPKKWWSYSLRQCYLFLENNILGPLSTWLTVAMRVCESLISLSKNLSWIKLITNATDAFYNLILNNQ